MKTWSETSEPDIIRPPFYCNGAAADTRRGEFDLLNGQIIANKMPVDAVFFGDSITHFWDVNNYFFDFGHIVNRGIGGDRVDIMVERFSGDVIQLKPRVCIILGGINNTWGIDYGAPKEDPEEVYRIITKSYRQLLTMAKEADIPILFGSVLPVGDKTEMGIRRNRLVCRLNEYIKELCKEFGSVYVDYHSAMVADDGITMQDGLTAPDGVHPHVAGYNRMANVLTPLLSKALK